MSYLDTLSTINLKDDTDINIVFTATEDVWFTEDFGEYDVFVNKTNAFEAWWEYMNLDTKREARPKMSAPYETRGRLPR